MVLSLSLSFSLSLLLIHCFSPVETKSEGHNSVSKSELPSAETTATQERPAHIKGVNSDAILSCPACLTTLCIDCQRYSTLHCVLLMVFLR